MKKKPWGHKKVESDDEASVDFDGENSESDYDENEKLLLEKTRKELAQGPYDSDEESEEEVFPLRNKLDQYEDSEEEDKDEEVKIDIEPNSDDDEGKNVNDSDIEGAESGSDDLPNDKAWGQLRRSFYNTDYLDKDHGGFEGEEDEETAKMEEEEARKINQRMMSELENIDLDSELFIGTKVGENAKDGADTMNDIPQMTKVLKDLSLLSDREKKKLLKIDSPEMFGLMTDFKTHMGSVQDKLSPFLKLVKSGDIPKSRFTEYIQCYYEIVLNYCTNIGFYFLLKALRKPVQNHPIMKRLLRFREILCGQNERFEIILPQIDKILCDIKTVESNSKASKNKSKKLLNLLTKPAQKADHIIKPKENNLENVIEKQKNKFEESTDEEEDETEVKEVPIMTTDEKRGITYQIAKNKGLTPRRKKELRNPRVKNRMKYRKAKIRRKGQISEPRKEIRRYDGEISGIKVNLSKSIKIKA